jgi:hypothetical protein
LRITLVFNNREADGLLRSAVQDDRAPRDQARFLVKQKLRELGALSDEESIANVTSSGRPDTTAADR